MTDFLSVLELLTSLDATVLLSMFWILAFVEGPRYLIASLLIGVQASRRSRSRTLVNSNTTITVLIPCHNGGHGLEKTARSIAEQTHPDIQVIVIDDGSTDNSAAIAKALVAEGLVDKVISTGLRGGKSAALNLGLGFSTGNVIVSVDADTTFDRDSFATITALFRASELGAVGGNVGVRNVQSSVLAAVQAVEYIIGISLGRKISALLGILPVVSGAFAAYRRDALSSVGGWEAGPGEDADLTIKLRRAGWEIAFAEDAWALTDAPDTMPALVRQRLRWESDLVRLHLRKFRCCLSPRQPGFSPRDAISTLDTMVFSVGFSIVFVVYVIWVCFNFGTAALAILAVATTVYCVLGCLTFIVAVMTSGGRTKLNLLPFAVGYGLYSVYVMHPIRLWACIAELGFDRSYRSTFVPTKVLGQIERF